MELVDTRNSCAANAHTSHTTESMTLMRNRFSKALCVRAPRERDVSKNTYRRPF